MSLDEIESNVLLRIIDIIKDSISGEIFYKVVDEQPGTYIKKDAFWLLKEDWIIRSEDELEKTICEE